MRLFTALLLSQDAITHLQSIQQRLSSKSIEHEIKLTPAENLHLTLKFLGDVRDEQVPELTHRLSQIKSPPMSLACNGLQFFPPRGSVRIIAARLSGEVDTVARLFDEIEAACDELGFEREGRIFSPHVTIGRNRQGRYQKVAGILRANPPVQDWPGPTFVASSFSLMKSELKPAGATYTSISTFFGASK